MDNDKDTTELLEPCEQITAETVIDSVADAVSVDPLATQPESVFEGSDRVGDKFEDELAMAIGELGVRA